MNPRRVHELFSKHCPSIDLAKCEWTHLLSDGRLNDGLLKEMLATLEASYLLIHVARKIGDYLPPDEALDFIRENIGKNMIYVSDRRYARLAIVAKNGVGTVWSSERDV